MNLLKKLAAQNNLPCRFKTMEEGHRSYIHAGVVVLDEKLTPERAHFAYCHELAHVKLNHLENPPRSPEEELEQERQANILASKIILPEDQFIQHAHKSLSTLKEIFPHASHEVIARRRLCFRPGLLTIYDNNRLYLRLCPDDWNIPRQLFPLEKKALSRCYESEKEVILSQDGLQVEATYVDEGRGVMRVILFLEGEMAGRND